MHIIDLANDEILSEYLYDVDFLTINEENRLKIKVKSLESEKDTKIAPIARRS